MSVEARPLAQINNPVKAPEFLQWGVKIKRTTKDRLVMFASTNEFTLQDVLDVALLDYMDSYERVQNASGGAVQSDEPMTDADEEEFDPFSDVPE